MNDAVGCIEHLNWRRGSHVVEESDESPGGILYLLKVGAQTRINRNLGAELTAGMVIDLS